MKGNNEIIKVLPGKTIGIIGGGQLGRMMAIAARAMGYKIIVLDPTPNCPTAHVAEKQIIAAYDDMNAIEELTKLSDVITYEFENIDVKTAAYIEGKGKLPQGTLALEVTQNREKEKNVIRDANILVPSFDIVKDRDECREVLQSITFPSVIKTCHGGYDGKGQFKIISEEDISQAISFVGEGHTYIIEKWISFDKEISVVFTRSQTGQITFFPTAENEHRNHILYQTTVPAKINKSVQTKAIKIATKLAEKLNVVGTFAIEMFVQGEDVYINEMAPRPHNSGHYTIEACNISQFTQHIRAICGLPLMNIRMLEPAMMINILGEELERVLQYIGSSNEGFVHLYGKEEAKESRKMGHITFIAGTTEELDELTRTFRGKMND